MSIDVEQDARADAIDQDAAAESSARSRILRFVAGFVVLVMTFLIGYRYAMNSRANIWYLFQVAKHTSWVLGIVGKESDVEPFRALGVAVKRRQLAEWDAIERGLQSLPDNGASDQTPFTAYESWQFEARSRIRDQGTIAEHGPIVRVILEEGLGTREAELRMELAKIRAETDADPAAAATRLQAIETELSGIRERLMQHTDGADRNRARRGVQFTFRVVPDCGAIPSMSIFLAAVLAFPALWWKRAVGAAGGLTLLYGINILRLATLGYIGAIDSSPGQRWFHFIHEYVWQGVFIVFVVAVWMLWIEVVVKVRRG